MPAKRKKSEKNKGLKREFLITVVITLVVVGVGLAYSAISKNSNGEPREPEAYVVAPVSPVPKYTEVKLGTCEFNVGVINNSNCIQAVRTRCKDRNQNMVFDSNWINTTSCRGKNLCYTMTDLGRLFNRVTPDMINSFRNMICRP